MARTQKPPARPSHNSSAEKTASRSSRQLKRPQYKSFRLSKKIKHPGRLPSAWQLLRQACGLLWQHKLVLGGVLAVYGVLQVVLVQGFTATGDFLETKTVFEELFGEYTNAWVSTATLFSYLVGASSQSTSAEGNVYQTLLLLVVSLAFIWALRHVVAGTQIRIRDAYYKGMYPLVPFVLVLAVIVLQLIPLVVAAWLYQVVIVNGIAVYAVEQILWLLLCLALLVLSVYWVCASLFALYIVALPDMTPVQALRTASQLVRYRRWTVIRKLLFLALTVCVLMVVIMGPVIAFVAPAAVWVFALVTLGVIGLAHSYMYILYRELLSNA